MLLSIALSSLLSALLVVAAPNPTEPGPSDVYNEGQDCDIKWDVDATGTWKTMYIELMTGPNLNQVHLSTVATLDATNATSYTYKCFDVRPNAPIYFYKFSSPQDPAGVLFTTRFTIAGPAGEVVAAPNRTQPGSNEPIPWGTGALVNVRDATPAPTLPPAVPTGGTTTSTGVVSTTSGGTTSPTGQTTVIPPGTQQTSSSPILPPTTSSQSVGASNTTGTPQTTGSGASPNTIASASLALIPLLSLLFIH